MEAFRGSPKWMKLCLSGVRKSENIVDETNPASTKALLYEGPLWNGISTRSPEMKGSDLASPKMPSTVS